MGGGTIYVGRLSSRAREEDLEDTFSRYGKIKGCQLKDGYAFIEYEDPRDAEDAVKEMDRRDFMGSRIIVEESRSQKKSGNTLFIGRISSHTTARDVEDLFYRYGRITRCDMKNDYAFVEFEDSRDAEEAMKREDGRELQGSRIIVEFAKSRGRESTDGKCFLCGERGHWARECPKGRGGGPGACFNCGEHGHIARECPNPRRGGSRSRSRSPRRKRRRSYSRSRSPVKRRRSRSKSPSRSPRRSVSRSRSRSPPARGSRSRSRSPPAGRSRSPVRGDDRRSPSRSPPRSSPRNTEVDGKEE